MQNYNSFFRASNEREFPGSAFLIYLCEPVIVVRYRAQALFADFEDFKNSIEEVKWVTELAWAKEEGLRDRIIRKAWAFLDGSADIA
jgi:hypothetical protein